MTIAVLCDENQQQELLVFPARESVQYVWADSLQSFLSIEAEAYFDLESRISVSTKGLKLIEGRLLFVNAVIDTLSQLPHGACRINAWPGFLRRKLAEVVLAKEANLHKCQELFTQMGREMMPVPDQPGMVVPRILASIINEAYYTLGDGVSTRPEIDTAMKLGTNYPKGPFEWSEEIGIDRIYRLLLELSKTDIRYKPSPALLDEIEKLIADGLYS